MPQHEFLLGTSPDIAVVVVDYQDDVSYIKRTFEYLRGVLDVEVIACVLYPMKKYHTSASYSDRAKKLSKEELETKKIELVKMLTIDVFTLGIKEDMKILSKKVITYFAE